ncbi:MAG: RNA polymerase sigma factor [Acidimicrobiales bacterium]
MTPDRSAERFERLFADNIDAVLGYALARVEPDTAKDAVAETFLVAWRRLPDVPDPARAWLLGVTRRTLAAQRRGRRRQHRLVERLVSGAVTASSVVVVAAAAAAAAAEFEGVVTERIVVAAALGRLRSSDRELLCLVAWDGLDRTELAEVLRCSPGAVDVRLHRARRRLRAALVAEDDIGAASTAPSAAPSTAPSTAPSAAPSTGPSTAPSTAPTSDPLSRPGHPATAIPAPEVPHGQD